MPDGGMVDIGQNGGPNNVSAHVLNSGRCPIQVRWFDITARGGKWRTRTLNPGQHWRHTLLVGEILQVIDVPDHHDSKFALIMKPVK